MRRLDSKPYSIFSIGLYKKFLFSNILCINKEIIILEQFRCN